MQRRGPVSRHSEGFMRAFFGNEMTRMNTLLLEERAPAAVLASSTLFLVLSRYFPTSPRIYGTLLYYAVLPLAAIALILRRNPLDFGLRIGQWRVWLPHVVAAGAFSMLLALAASRIPAFREYYGGEAGPPAHRAALSAASLAAIEFMFRGFILFGLKDRFGGGAVFVQMAPFALLHLHKPGLEAAGCVVSGTYFGYLAWRTGSLWPAYLIHLVAALSMTMLAA